MSLTTKQHNAIALITFCALLVFFRLNSAQFHPEESRIVFKAELVNQFNGWLDLAPYSSTDGSFSMAPISIWMTALTLKYIGNLPLHVRLISSLFSAFSLVLLYQITRRLVGYQLSLIAPVLLASTLVWNEFARQVSDQIPAAMFTLLGLWCLMKFHENTEKKSRLWFTLIYAFSITGSFLSGIIAGGITLLIIIPFVTAIRKERSVWLLLLGLLIGIVSPIAWYSHVYFSFRTHDSTFSLLKIGTSIVDLLLSQPFSLLAFLAPIFFIKFRKGLQSIHKVNTAKISLLLWFLGLLLCTGFNTYSSLVLLSPAVIVLSLISYERLASPQKARLAWLAVLGLGATTYCSLSTSGAEFIGRLTHGGENIFSIIPIIVIVFLVVFSGLFLPKNRVYQLTNRLLLWCGIIIPAILILRIAISNISRTSSIEIKEANGMDIEKNRRVTTYYHSPYFTFGS